MDSNKKAQNKVYDRGERSWFIVLAHPRQYFPETKDMSPEELCKFFCNSWQAEHGDNCAFACALCISADGLEHIHCIAENPNKTTFYALQKFFRNAAHLEPTKGTKKQAEDYIYKRGAFSEKGEKVLHVCIYGNIAGAQGKRNDLASIEDLINSGLTPDDIFQMDIRYRKYDKIIKEAFFSKRKAETPTWRDVRVIYHVGAEGSGKSYQIRMMYTDDEMYTVTDYDSGFDLYSGQRVLLLEEYRGQLKYSVFLVILDNYKSQVHARYTNIIGLWNEVHITSPLPPELVFSKMVKQADQAVDLFGQLRRRLTEITYHWKDVDGNYQYFKMSATDYIDYVQLQTLAFDNLVLLCLDGGAIDIYRLCHMCWSSLFDGRPDHLHFRDLFKKYINFPIKRNGDNNLLLPP